MGRAWLAMLVLLLTGCGRPVAPERAGAATLEQKMLEHYGKPSERHSTPDG